MRQGSRLFLLRAIALGTSVGWAASCASFSDSSNGPSGNPNLSGDGGNIALHPGDAGDAGPKRIPGVSPLCGTADFCFQHIPDDPDACADFDGGNGGVKAPGSDAASNGGATGAGGAASSGGAPATGGVATSLDAGDAASDAAADASVDASSNDAGPTRGAREAGIEAGPPRARDGGRATGGAPGIDVPGVDAGPLFACQVNSDDSGSPVRGCGRAGPGDVNAPCASSGDCRATLACVGDKGAGRCLPYCCSAKSTRCGAGTYCGKGPLLELGSTHAALKVPVCLPADHCQLLEPYPCTGSSCVCDATTACTIVRGDGTTSCVEPGGSKAGEPCPCAAGYFCSSAIGLCVQICDTADQNACASGKCQATAGFPDGYGLCIGSQTP
jgi:hypothetical protein